MKEFLIYEEYAGKYESMANQLACAYKELPTKEIVERGIEVLAHALQPLDARAEDGKKGLTFQDLLIKVVLFSLQKMLANQYNSAYTTDLQVSSSVQ